MFAFDKITKNLVRVLSLGAQVVSHLKRVFSMKSKKLLFVGFSLLYLITTPTYGSLLGNFWNSLWGSQRGNVSFYDSKIALLNYQHLPYKAIESQIRKDFPVEDFREVKAQIIFKDLKTPQHIIVYFLDKAHHSVSHIKKITINSHYQFQSIDDDYKLTPEDIAQQPGPSVEDATCPDNDVQFIAFAPNSVDIEQSVTVDVANTAIAHGLKTVSLLLQDATRANYLNYLTCPKVIGNFYDGDADPKLITTVDGVISASEIAALNFREQMTNIWLACEAYNDPMKSAVIDSALTQKYAAGIDDLLIGPSDKAGACAMKAAINGQAMREAFWSCYKADDISSDIWQFGGKGSDYFGQKSSQRNKSEVQ